MIAGKAYFAICCNGCGENLCDDGEHSHWESPDSALEMARDFQIGAIIARYGMFAACPACVDAYIEHYNLDEDREEALRDEESLAMAGLESWARATAATKGVSS